MEFDILNQAAMTVTDLVFEVSVAQKPELDQGPGPKRVVAGPFTIKGTIDLDAGYTIAYESSPPKSLLRLQLCARSRRRVGYVVAT